MEMIGRRMFIGSLAGLLGPLEAWAQQADRVARVGFLSSSAAEREKSLLAALQQGLQELGYSEGKNLLIEPRYSGGRFDALPALAAELVRIKVDVLVVTGAPAAHAAKNATRVIPIVMTNAADPVGTGLVASLARPGGNVTGLSDFNAGVVVKRLELLKETIPTVSRVGVLLNPANPTNPLQMKLTQDAAPTLGVSLLAFEVRRLNEIDTAFAAMRRERPGALIVIGDPFLGSHRTKITDLAATNRLPAIYSHRSWVDDGGLVSYGTSFHDLYRRASTYVDKILKGASPGDLPIEQPSKFELVLNLRTARVLGITLPPSLMLRADHVID